MPIVRIPADAEVQIEARGVSGRLLVSVDEGDASTSATLVDVVDQEPVGQPLLLPSRTGNHRLVFVCRNHGPSKYGATIAVRLIRPNAAPLAVGSYAPRCSGKPGDGGWAVILDLEGLAATSGDAA